MLEEHFNKSPIESVVSISVMCRSNIDCSFYLDGFINVATISVSQLFGRTLHLDKKSSCKGRFKVCVLLCVGVHNCSGNSICLHVCKTCTYTDLTTFL